MCPSSQAGRYSLLGPRTVNQLVPGKYPARKPKAKVHRIRSITVRFMAYAAVLVKLLEYLPCLHMLMHDLFTGSLFSLLAGILW